MSTAFRVPRDRTAAPTWLLNHLKKPHVGPFAAAGGIFLGLIGLLTVKLPKESFEASEPRYDIKMAAREHKREHKRELRMWKLLHERSLITHVPPKKGLDMGGH
eukprot:TRINITY_DN8762_c0_g1_i3.p2 TRINITY_DN8762_c0_g1~~TRINITY_DN8762_c0_g1_i3.p2  ORF type:complete len:104 (+),score=39.63 TRINITY_DN8762_c0_g1_i3:58-369(+)